MKCDGDDDDDALIVFFNFTSRLFVLLIGIAGTHVVVS